MSAGSPPFSFMKVWLMRPTCHSIITPTNINKVSAEREMEGVGKQSFERWKELLNTWDLRVIILFSLFFQTFLIFFAPLRKRTGSGFIIIPIWLAYLLADLTANFALGLISRRQGDTSGPFSRPELVAFWVPFLLLHLGGPDTITGFALEDNELWLRHLLQLLVLCGTAAYVFILTLSFKNQLWIPTLLVLVAGLIKYIERTRSLNLASWRRLREPDPGPYYAELMDIYFPKKEANVPVRIELIPEAIRSSPQPIDEDRAMPLEDLDVVIHAYDFFQTFKGFLVDLRFSSGQLNKSRTFFLGRTARDAFKVVEAELNFIYEILYTKVRVLRGKYGYLLRFVSFISIVVALVLFCLIDKHKQGFHKFDVGITFTLLLGAIALDIIAFLMLLLSDRTAVALTNSDNQSVVFRMLKKSLNFNRKRWPEDSPTQHCTCSFGWFKQIMRRRWSESIPQYNYIDYCLHPRLRIWEKLIGFFGLTNMLDGLQYAKTVEFTNDLRELVFEELKMKSKMAYNLESAKEIYLARGDWVLRHEDCTDLLPWIIEVDFDESLHLWHIATDLCFHSCNVSMDANAEDGDSKNKDFRGLSKLLSDYMAYLLNMESTVMTPVEDIGKIRFKDTSDQVLDTLADAKKFFSGRKIGKVKEDKKCCLNIFSVQKCCCKGRTGPDQLHEQACKSILLVNTEVKPPSVRGDRSKSVLFDACVLAKELEKLEERKKWVIISKVWVEMLSYAARRCRATTHAAQLSKGGQLITLVWLLMSHLGLEDQSQAHEAHGREKLIVGS
ncbi:unnamed protein product [Camellia sinensis]